MLGPLSRLRSWDFDHKEEDIRGWPLCDVDGNVIGTVHDLIVDTKSQHVIELQLKDGRRLAAHDVVLGDRTLTVAQSAGREAPQAIAATSA